LPLLRLKINISSGRCRGIIYYTKGIHETSFKQGLNEETNSQVEALALFQGVGILDLRRIMSFLVIGDTLIIVRHMHHATI
jgi:hypothetical protein